MLAYTIEQTLDEGPVYEWHEIPVACDVDWMSITLDYTGSSALYVMVWDARGALRLQNLAMQTGETLHIGREAREEYSPAGLSPGCVSGEIVQGTWRLLLAGQASKHPLSYRLVVEGNVLPAPIRLNEDVRDVAWVKAEPGEEFVYNLLDQARIAERSTRWYRGDFHMHTRLSDGKLTARELTDLAEARGLDFICITEHNILTTAWVETPVLVIPGTEYTSTKGHWNAIGLHKSVPLITDRGPIFEYQEGMDTLLATSREQGALCSMNHPCLRPWDWTWMDTSLSSFDTVEIVNDPTFPSNAEATERSIRLLDLAWARGHQVWAIGGSDTHMRPTESHVEGGPPSIVGDPTTCVWADTLSIDGIVDAARQGHTYITRGPALDPLLVVDGVECQPGDNLSTIPVHAMPNVGLHLHYRLAVVDAPRGGMIRWIENGSVLRADEVRGDGTYTLDLAWDPTVYRWLRIEIRNSDGSLAAYVNPVYVAAPAPEKRESCTWGGLVGQLDTAPVASL